MVNKKIESLCEIVKTFGSTSPSKMGNGRMYLLEITLEEPLLDGDTGLFEGVKTRFQDLVYDPEIGFTPDHEPSSSVTKTYTLSNWDKGNFGHFLPDDKLKLPKGISTMTIVIPTEKWDELMGRNGCALPKDSRGVKINCYPKTIDIRIWDDKPID